MSTNKFSGAVIVYNKIKLRPTIIPAVLYRQLIENVGFLSYDKFIVLIKMQHKPYDVIQSYNIYLLEE